jgi:TonB family protein
MTKALRVAIWVLAVVAMVATGGTAFAQPKQIRVGGNIQQMNLVKKVAPMYPVAMKAQGLEAVVLLNVVISGEGVPTSISVQDTTVPREFTDAAIEAVKEWQYKPTLLNGEPVEVVTTVQINFSLAK